MPGKPYVVQANDTLSHIITEVLARVPPPKPSDAQIWAPGGLISKLAQHLGLENPNLINTGATFQIPPAEFFQS